jgi:hypothetical protein
VNVDLSKLVALLKQIEADGPAVIAGLTDFITKANASPALALLEARFPAIKTLDDEALKILGFLSTLEAETLPWVDKIVNLLEMFEPKVAQ